MSDEMVAFEHVATQVFQRWRPPPVWSARSSVRGEFVVPKEWAQTAYWLDVSSAYRDWTAESRQRVAKAAGEHFLMLGDAGGKYIPFWHESYPPLLRFIPDPPLALSALGSVSWLRRDGVAIVGSRKASGRGMQAAMAMGRGFGQRGIPVVSGGAIGCDIGAHWGVVSAQAREAAAVVVFAGGLWRLYPRRNQELFDRLIASGAVMVSERLWAAPSWPSDFPVRNRIISGMVRTTIVAQAGRRSGAYITARWALDQGRDVVVLEHPSHDIRAAGSHELLDDGATSLVDVEDLFGDSEENKKDRGTTTVFSRLY